MPEKSIEQQKIDFFRRSIELNNHLPKTGERPSKNWRRNFDISLLTATSNDFTLTEIGALFPYKSKSNLRYLSKQRVSKIAQNLVLKLFNHLPESEKQNFNLEALLSSKFFLIGFRMTLSRKRGGKLAEVLEKTLAGASNAELLQIVSRKRLHQFRKKLPKVDPHYRIPYQERRSKTETS